jgi:hypothetical protein
LCRRRHKHEYADLFVYADSPEKVLLREISDVGMSA